MAPDPVGPPGGKRRVQVGATEIANASVMRLEYSLEKSSCLTGGSSPLFVMDMVGIESSSLTPGSSTVRVAGKNRLPAISCANARVSGMSKSASPNRAALEKRVDMVCSAVFLRRECDCGQSTASLYAYCGGPRGNLLG